MKIRGFIFLLLSSWIMSSCSFKLSMEDLVQQIAMSDGQDLTMVLPVYVNKVTAPSVPLSGHCPREASTVQLFNGAILLGQFPCVAGAYSGQIDLSSTSDGSVNLRAVSAASSAQEVVTVGSTYLDTVPPTAPSSLSSGSAFSSLVSLGLVNYVASSDSGSGVQKYQRRVVKVSDSSIVSDWADYTSGTAVSGVSLVENSTYRIEIRAIDFAGNTSTTSVSNGWLVDTLPPQVIAPFSAMNFSSSTDSPMMLWTPTSDAGSGVSSYQVALGTSPGAVDVLSWSGITPTLNGAGSLQANVTGLSLSNGVIYYPSLRALDNAGNVSSVRTGTGSFRAVSVWKNQEPTLPAYTGKDIYASAIQSDGKKLIGGSFTHLAAYPVLRAGLLNTNGSLDTSFQGMVFDGSVFTTALQSDGKIIMGGGFLHFRGEAFNRLLRLNADGTLDRSFSVGTGFDNNVLAVLIQPDGKILVTGSFSIVNGVSLNGIVRLNSDGSIDSSFNLGTGFNQYAVGNSLAIQNDGKILVGGALSTYQGFSQIGLMRINPDGSPDTSFNLGTGFDGSIESVAIQNDGKILVAGNFVNFQGSSQNHLIRLNSDGTKDASFNIGTGFDQIIYKVKLQSDGQILVAGFFTHYQGGVQKYFVRLNTNGTKDATLNIGAGFGSSVMDMEVQSDGKIIAVGGFSTYQGVTANQIVRMTSTGNSDATFVTGLGFNGTGGTVSVVLLLANGQMLVGGSFTDYQGVSQNRLGRINLDGTRDAGFNIGTGFDNSVNDIATVNDIVIQSNGKILVGGGFITYQGLSQNGLIRLNQDGSKDGTLNIGTGFSGPVNTIAVQSDGRILVGGFFTTYQGASRSYIVRLNADGSVDSSFNMGSGFNSLVFKIALQSDGKILVGGWFTSYNGQSQNYIVRLNTDGTFDNTFLTGGNLDAPPMSILQQADGKILLGGQFVHYGRTTQPYLLRLNADGSLDTSFQTGTGPNLVVNAMALQSDGKILVGGPFTSYQGVARQGFVRINADGSLDTTMNSYQLNAYAEIKTISILSDGKIFLGGKKMELYNNVNVGTALLLGW